MAVGLALFLSVNEYERIHTTRLSAELDARHRDNLHCQVDSLMEQRMGDFMIPLKADGIEAKTVLQTGQPRAVIVQMPRSIVGDLLIIGSHSRRGIGGIALGGTARRLTHEAPCTVLIVSPKV
jgi:hypothetical protein